MSNEKEKERFSKENFIYTSCESNINAVAEEHILIDNVVE